MPDTRLAPNTGAADPEPNWSREQQRHMQWLALPKTKRQPATKTEWADVLGRTRRTLQNWERLPGFMDAVWSLSRGCVADDLPDIMAALVESALQGNTAAARLVLEATGRVSPAGACPSVRVANVILTAQHIDQVLSDLAQWEQQHEPDPGN